jgi:nascent polypeptide-associated complex subunit alpha
MSTTAKADSKSDAAAAPAVTTAPAKAAESNAKKGEAAPTKEKPTVESDNEGDEDEDEDEDDEMPALESAAAVKEEEGKGALVGGKGGKQNRSEKKARKAMQKLGMKQVPGIVRVTVKKAKNILFVISKPDVFKSPAADTYIIFGEAKIEDINSQNLEHQARQFQQGGGINPLDALNMPDLAPGGAMGGLGGLGGAGGGAGSGPVAAGSLANQPSDPNEVVDETGLDKDEINTVMSQTSCPRAQAVKALRKTGNIVDAILALTP